MYLSEWLKLKKTKTKTKKTLTISNTGADAKQLKLLYTAAEPAKWLS